MRLAFNVPVNPVSFGQVSYNLLKAAKAAGHDIEFFPIGDIDLSTVGTDVPPDFQKFLQESHEKGMLEHNRDTRTIRLWHLVTPDRSRVNGSYDSISNNQTFISFYELDAPTKLELNVARNFDTLGSPGEIKIRDYPKFPCPFTPEDWKNRIWRAGEWNELRARIVGNPPVIHTWINGVKVMEFTDDRKRLPDRGGIGLQLHGHEDSTGRYVRYRNIQVTVLEDRP